ncbi:hypothetical protein SAMN04487831_11635 [Pseudobutyrivibrio sp. UC1225]|uniref:HAD family hydrolase n=1 Tax=Pseudobutyrivibrio sp. UC1225 TaxID=1798185 RepID=UPI0008F1B02E|nr:HAD family hydrolase [Pseudobutyrivibrio sp. UC1225]SFO28656.1 hypothetical protein SAMN04487831_11635 [Pseudobutyrivibrio sp. UC1225]
MMRNNIKKMIVTDLDGTFLKDDKTISDYSIEIIKTLRNQGHVFVVATARPLRAARKFLKKIDIDAGIYHNGALIYIDDMKVDNYQIENPVHIIDIVKKKNPHCSVAVESNDVLYSNFDAEKMWPGTDYELVDSDFSIVEGKKADKIIVKLTSHEEVNDYAKLLPDDLYIQVSENIIGMIMKKSATKRNGISYVAEKYEINREDIIAFGDDYNDIDMMEFAGKGICVANGLDIVKEKSDEVCESNENDGVCRWLEDNLMFL